MSNFLKRHFWQLLLVFVITLPTLRFLFLPGFFPMHDDMQVMRVYQMSKCITDGQFPCRWVPDMGYGFGYPQFTFYGPLPYYFMTLLSFAGLSLMTAVKVGFAASLLFGNLTLYFLAKQLFKSDRASLVAATLYAYLPYRASDLFSRGAMGESWAFVFIPLVLLGAFRVLTNPKPSSAILFGLSSALLITTHNVSTLIYFPFIGLFLGLYLFVFSKSQSKPLIFKTLLQAIILGGLLSAFFLLPVLLERSQVHIESMLGGYFDYRRHFLAFSQLFNTTSWAYGSSDLGPFDDLSFFYGPLLIAFAILGLIRSLRNFKRYPQLALAVSIFFAFGLISTFMTHSRSSFIYEQITTLHFLQFPWRFLVTANFFFCVAAGSLFIGDKPKYVVTFLFIILPIILSQFAFFKPIRLTTETSAERLSGAQFDRMMTISIFDYLPKATQFPPNHSASIQPSFSDRHYRLSNQKSGTNWYRFELSSESEQQVSVPIFNYPGWQVHIDKKLTNHFSSDNDGQITFIIPSGHHQVDLKLQDTPPRLIGNILTVFGLIYLYHLSRKSHA